MDSCALGARPAVTTCSSPSPAKRAALARAAPGAACPTRPHTWSTGLATTRALEPDSQTRLDRGKTTGHFDGVAQRSLKEQLVDAGSRVLFEKGFHASSINDIVDAAGVPKGSFYNHFESKEALALEAVRRYVESYDFSGLRQEGGSPLARLRAHFRSVAELTIARGVGLGCMLGNFSTEFPEPTSAIRQFVSGALTAWGNEVATCLEAAQAAGELAESVDTHALGHYLVNAYEGAVARAKVSGDRAPLDAFITLTFDVLVPSRATAPQQKSPKPRPRARR
jgi:TetR/AcrR family transcriptional repressor of nem operon